MPTRNKQEDKITNLIDQLTQFEDFQEDILPALRKAIKDKKTAKEILAMGEALAAARLVTIAVTEVDSGKASSASKDILDRTQGKATERKEVKHTFENMSDDELNAILQSELKEIAEETDTKVQ